MKILLVEDDLLLASGIAEGLRLAQYETDVVSSGEAALVALHEGRHDLVILDLGLPDMDGVNLLRRIKRENEDVLVLVMTARDALSDRVRGLDLGADDYLVKPVAFAELEARIRAVMRRHQHGYAGRLTCGSLVMDNISHTVWIGDRKLAVTPREWTLLELFVKYAGELVRKEKIVSTLESHEGSVSLNAVEVYVSRLRTKLEPHVHIRTVRGYGYLMEKGDEGA